MQVLEYSAIMDWNLLTRRGCECPLSSSSSRVLSSLSSSTSSYSRSDSRRLQRLRSQVKGSSVQRKTFVSYPDLCDGFRSNVERGHGNTSSFFVKGDKESLPLYFPLKTSLIVEDDCQEEEDKEESSLTFHHHHDIENQDDEEEELGAEEPPLALQSRVENNEGIPIKDWLLKFFNSMDPRVRGIILLNMLTFLYGKFSSPLRPLIDRFDFDYPPTS